jgi:hypothetical protein
MNLTIYLSIAVFLITVLVVLMKYAFKDDTHSGE